MGKNLYVGGISYSSTEETLKAAFSAAGEVESVRIITDKFSGRSKGFGFVTMKDEAGAAKAIEMFDGQEVDGRKIKVNEARPMEQR